MELLLNNILKNYDINNFPEEWKMYSLESFSNKKTLFNYQEQALKNILITMYIYFEELEDFKVTEEISINANRKKSLHKKYLNLNADVEKLDIKPAKKNNYLYEIYEEFVSVTPEKTISFANFVNRLSLWMATASGKTLVIIKLFEMLQTLIERNQIPNNDILFLAPKDKIIDQTIALAKEYNVYYKNKYIRFVSLKDYEVDKVTPRITSSDEITVYYYRSDNISDRSGEVFLNYKDYINNGKWYVILDEAHKGSKDSSKRQAYYTLMSSNGFLFNLSATFTEEEDFLTNAYNFNLEKFIQNGYGKNIYLSNSQFNFVVSDEQKIIQEKQRIVFKSLIIQTASKLASKKIREINREMYHSPLGVTLTNTVTQENSDLHLYFNELKRFAENDFDFKIFEEAKKELVKEMRKKKFFVFDNIIENLDFETIEQVTPETVLLEIFNSESFSSIEYLDSKDQKEIGLRLKSSTISSPFALIKIGEISEWKKSILKGYSYTGSFEVKNYFDNINENENINILMGSRAFYEGWDSPRPNVLNCINIGKTDATKFVLQAIGRGLRLEPVKNTRKRIKHLYYEGKIPDKLYQNVVKYSALIESLFIFSTDDEMIKSILVALEEQKTSNKTKKIELNKAVQEHKLLVPVYKEIKREQSKLPKFAINKDSLKRLRTYFNSTSDGVILMQAMLTPNELSFIKSYVAEDRNIKITEESYYDDLLLSISKLVSLYYATDKIFERFKNLESEIIHFMNVEATDEDYNFIQKEVTKVSNFSLVSSKPEKMIEELQNGNVAAVAHYRDLEIKNIAGHYYYPLISTASEEADYINHIIKVESEYSFIKKLEEFLKNNKKTLNEKYEWWMFSKLDESLDKIYIPYMDNGISRNFNPDFVFWMQKDNDYRIVFVDPKGTSASSFINKVSGYEKIYKNKVFSEQGLNITVDLILYNTENPFEDNYYSSYWKSEIQDIFEIFKK